MFYVYILASETNGGFYIGCTKDLKKRLKAHDSGQVESTHSTSRSEARGMLRVDTEQRFLPRLKNRGLALSNVSTRKRLPMKLIYYEACLDEKDAFHREKYLKTTYGRRYLRHRLKGYFTG